MTATGNPQPATGPVAQPQPVGNQVAAATNGATCNRCGGNPRPATGNRGSIGTRLQVRLQPEPATPLWRLLITFGWWYGLVATLFGYAAATFIISVVASVDTGVTIPAMLLVAVGTAVLRDIVRPDNRRARGTYLHHVLVVLIASASALVADPSIASVTLAMAKGLPGVALLIVGLAVARVGAATGAMAFVALAVELFTLGTRKSNKS